MTVRPAWPAVSGAATFQDIRRALAGQVVKSAAGALRTGILPIGTGPLMVGTASMIVNVQTCVVVLDRNGAVFLPNDGVQPVQLSSAPSSGSRWSVVYAKQRETESPFSDTVAGPLFDKVESTQSETAARNLLPAGARELGVWKVDAGATTTDAANGVTYTETVLYTAMEGGTVLLRSQAEQDAWAPHVGSTAYRIDTKRKMTRLASSSAPNGEWLPDVATFLARRKNTQSFGNSGWFGIADAFGAADFNDLGTWSPGALQVARSGLYRIGLNVRLQNGSSPMAAQVTKNSGAPDTGVQLDLFASGATSLSGSAVVPLAGGDVLRALVYTSVANAIDTVDQRGLQLSVELLSLT